MNIRQADFRKQRIDYKLQELGEWAVNDEMPTPSFYS